MSQLGDGDVFVAPIASANDHTYSLVVREGPADVEVVAEVSMIWGNQGCHLTDRKSQTMITEFCSHLYEHPGCYTQYSL